MGHTKLWQQKNGQARQGFEAHLEAFAKAIEPPTESEEADPVAAPIETIYKSDAGVTIRVAREGNMLIAYSHFPEEHCDHRTQEFKKLHLLLAVKAKGAQDYAQLLKFANFPQVSLHEQPHINVELNLKRFFKAMTQKYGEPLSAEEEESLGITIVR